MGRDVGSVTENTAVSSAYEGTVVNAKISSIITSVTAALTLKDSFNSFVSLISHTFFLL